MSSLVLNKNIQRVLLSTRSRLVGEYFDPEYPSFHITHAWLGGSQMSRALSESPFSQSFYVASILTEPTEQNSTLRVLPDYSYWGEFVATHLSILYGKHFVSLGPLESNGMFHVPERLELEPNSLHRLPTFNHKPRRCVPTTLDLREVTRIRKVLNTSAVESDAERILFTAGRFYNRALTEIDELPELAYLDFITCGEILSAARPVDEDSLLDENLKHILNEIKLKCSDGPKVASEVRDRVYQVRRRFAVALSGLLDDYFFANSESEIAWAVLKQETIEKRLKAAYDLRSSYVHSGVQFGGFVRPLPSIAAETVMGKPIMGDKKLAKIIFKAPSLCGMERIMRYCLLKVAGENGADLAGLCEPSKDKSAPEK